MVGYLSGLLDTGYGIMRYDRMIWNADFFVMTFMGGVLFAKLPPPLTFSITERGVFDTSARAFTVRGDCNIIII